MNLHTNLDLTAYGLGWGAVLWISTVSATIFWIFFNFFVELFFEVFPGFFQGVSVTS